MGFISVTCIKKPRKGEGVFWSCMTSFLYVYQESWSVGSRLGIWVSRLGLISLAPIDPPFTASLACLESKTLLSRLIFIAPFHPSIPCRHPRITVSIPGWFPFFLPQFKGRRGTNPHFTSIPLLIWCVVCLVLSCLSVFVLVCCPCLVSFRRPPLLP